MNLITSIARPLVLSTALLLPLASVGCNMMNEAEPTSPQAIKFSVDSSHDKVWVGEIVTFQTSTANTLGKDAKIEWSTTGGKLTEEENGRIARVNFDKAGTYTVTALLRGADGIVKSDQSVVTVKPLN